MDSFKPRRRIPCCYMQAVLSRDSSTLDRDPVPVLSHKVVLQGARQPYNTIKINFIPSSNRTTHVPRITQELSGMCVIYNHYDIMTVHVGRFGTAWLVACTLQYVPLL